MMFRVGVMGGAGGRASAESLSGLPGGDTRHWRHLEFGTERTRAQPFMLPALEQNQQKVAAEFIDQYNRKLSRLLK
jgi:HK97 gp10 family phage protein